jgi:hypothetical protein
LEDANESFLWHQYTAGKGWVRKDKREYINVGREKEYMNVARVQTERHIRTVGKDDCKIKEGGRWGGREVVGEEKYKCAGEGKKGNTKMRVGGGTERYIRKVCEGRLLHIIQVVGVAEIRIGWVKKAHYGKVNRG